MRTDAPTWVTRFFEGLISRRVVVFIGAVAVCLWGAFVAPFDWDLWGIERAPIAVDAIPDIGENQQIVFTEWPGRSPQDIDDQITYPLTVALLGLPHVRTVRSSSAFGFSSIYVIFDDEVDFYWSRARIVEKLASLAAGTLPDGVAPQLGPDATALGQVLWYTLEGRDPDGAPVGGWDLQELRTLQDFVVRFGLAAADGVSEVASIGGFVQEYQVDVDPDALRAFDVRFEDVVRAVRESNTDVGARTLEMSGVEYLVRGVGFLESLADLEAAVVAVRDRVPVRVRDVAHVQRGPAARRGALDRGGAESVGGVVVARYGANPVAVLDSVHEAIEGVQDALPSRVLPDGTRSQVTIVPVYDRSALIERTIGTLERALYQQVLVTVLVVLILLVHLRSSLLISGLLPIAVLATFAAMKATGVTANVVALAGIAIAIGTMVDLGIVVTENIVQHLRDADPETPRSRSVATATAEVAGAVLVAVTTTVVSFLPVFLLEGAEGKLFGPLAATKTFALVASVIVALTVLPAAAYSILGRRALDPRRRLAVDIGLTVAGAIITATLHVGAGLVLVGLAVARRLHAEVAYARVAALIGIGLVGALFSASWAPLGADARQGENLAFVAVIVGGLLSLFWLFRVAYRTMLSWVLDHKLLFSLLPLSLVAWGGCAWLGFGAVAGWLPDSVHRSGAGQWAHHAFPGLGHEFMPQLDEGAFLYMPSTMPHASIGEALDALQQLDRAIESVPEVAYAIGKLGRAETALDPAPVSMIETLIEYQPEYRVTAEGQRQRFAVDADGRFVRDADGALVPDPEGSVFRNWRPEIETPEDIWDAIVAAAQIPGVTSAPLLQPISTRIVMLQSGIRAPMAVRLMGPDLEALGEASLDLEALLRTHPMVSTESVSADRPVGKPYLEIHPDREAMARYGLSMQSVQSVIETAIGGRALTYTVEGRERYPVRVRYPRELRDSPEDLLRVQVHDPAGAPVPLSEVATISYHRGPQAIRSEDAQLVTYVMFDGAHGTSEVEVVESVRQTLDAAQADGRLVLPEGVRFTFAGSYENAERARGRLAIVVPLVLFSIFLLLYVQFRSAWTAAAVFAGVAVALAGGFMLIWAYGRPGFLDVELFGASLRDVFRVGPVNLSVAVWVGFIALFGIATDDGVVMATYLDQRFKSGPVPGGVAAIRSAVVDAGCRRIRPCLMTTATTILALLPVLTSFGTGADVMIPMAIPAVGGMVVELITLFVVPMLYCAGQEARDFLLTTASRSPHNQEIP